MRYEGYFDKVLVEKIINGFCWTLYQIEIRRPHMYAVPDKLLCVSWGKPILSRVRKGSPISVVGYNTSVFITDIDFTKKQTLVFVADVESIGEHSDKSKFQADESIISELLIDYYNKTE